MSSQVNEFHLKTVQCNLNKKKVLLAPYNTEPKTQETSAYRVDEKSTWKCIIGGK